jgi:hypothetical protein
MDAARFGLAPRLAATAAGAASSKSGRSVPAKGDAAGAAGRFGCTDCRSGICGLAAELRRVDPHWPPRLTLLPDLCDSPPVPPPAFRAEGVESGDCNGGTVMSVAHARSQAIPGNQTSCARKDAEGMEHAQCSGS